MRAPLIILILILLAVLALVGYNSGWFGDLGPAPGAGPAVGDTAAPGAEPEEPVGDGGVEQLPDEAQPQPPADPVEVPGDTPAAVSFEHFPAGDLIPGSGSGYLD